MIDSISKLHKLHAWKEADRLLRLPFHKRSAADLKKLAWAVAAELAFSDPEIMPITVISDLDPGKSCDEFVKDLARLVPAFRYLQDQLSDWTPIKRLRRACRDLCGFHEQTLREREFVKEFDLNFGFDILLLRYELACQIKREKLGLKLLHDSDEITQCLFRSSSDGAPPKDYDRLRDAYDRAEQEITDLLTNKKFGKIYRRLFEKHHNKCLSHISQFVSGYMQDIYQIAAVEYRIQFDQVASELFGLPDIAQSSKREYSRDLLWKLKERVNRRISYGPGGARSRKGFVWREEHKVQLFLTVSKLPTIEKRPMWKYAFDRLIEEDFASRLVCFLRSKTPFKGVSQTLFSEMIRKWRKYSNSLVTVSRNETPRAFEFRHAIEILNYPEITFLTSLKYFSEGKASYVNNTSKPRSNKIRNRI